MIYPKTFFSRFDLPSEEPDLVFVLMPFAQAYEEVYHEVIKPLSEDLGLRCLRADEIFGPGPVVEGILESIAKSRIIVADVTDRNPNVFYELGIAHTVKDRVVIITQAMDDVPFDLRHLRCIAYSQTLRGSRQLRADLKKTIETILAEGIDPDWLVKQAQQLVEGFSSLIKALDERLAREGLGLAAHDQALLDRTESNYAMTRLGNGIENVKGARAMLELMPESSRNRARLDGRMRNLQQTIEELARLLYQYEQDWK